MIDFRQLIVKLVRGDRRCLPTERRTARKIIDTHQETDYDRWRDIDRTIGTWNPTRAERIAAIIPGGVSVLDFGAGTMVLQRYLKTNCVYTPSDLYDRGNGCIVVNLNRYEFPDGYYDWITIIGLLEYMKDPRWVVSRAARAASRVVVPTTRSRAFPMRIYGAIPVG